MHLAIPVLMYQKIQGIWICTATNLQQGMATGEDSHNDSAPWLSNWSDIGWIQNTLAKAVMCL